MYCRNCGHQVDEMQSACPNCGALQNEVVKVVEKEKKPITKRWWFWVIIIFVAFSVLGGGPASDGENNDSAVGGDSNPSEEVIEISARDLFAAYEENEVAADQKYKGKKLKVTGTIKDFGTNILDDSYITLETEEYFLSIQCYFKESELDKVTNLSKGQTITLIGVCDGMSMNVVIENCEIE